MLDTLSGIIQEVNEAEDLNNTLAIIVRRVRKAMSASVCSVYLLDADAGSYVLMATQGLKQSAVGRASLALEEGLVGLVAQRAEPVNLKEASSHPRYRYIPETGEEEFEAFLGVPVIHHREVLGVLVVQEAAGRSFDAAEEAFLITLSAQLAGIIASAAARGAITGVSPTGVKTADTCFAGVPGAPGVAIAEAVTVFPLADLNAIPQRRCKDIKKEIRFFNDCLNAVRIDINVLKVKTRGRLRPEERELFDAYMHMLSDQALGAEVVAHIKKGNWAQGALAKVAREHVRDLELLENDYLNERATDIKDLCGRVLFYLQEKEKETRVYPPRCVLVSEELSAAMLAEVPRKKLAGVISAKGSGHSHVAILARAMGIPAAMGVLDLPFAELDGKEVIVDGYNGQVYSNPSDELRERFQAIVREEEQLTEGLESIRDLPCETLDGRPVELWVNTGLMTDVLRSRERGAEGIGLFRTEVPFLLRDRFPSEREQTEIYRQQLELFHPKKVNMRMLDIGGDKSLPYFSVEEENPFMGWRGIRVSMDHPEIFIAQVRAMMAASVNLDNLQILLPMVSNMNEVDYSIRLIKRARQELLEEGQNVVRPKVGAMLEVPALMYQIKALVKRVDFISVGTNDLSQYLFAVDRNNPRVSGIYSTLHPSFLQALKKIADEVHGEKIETSVCGEMAGDPGAAVLLMAMGYDKLSMNATSLLKVKSVLRNVAFQQARELLDKVLQQEDAEAVRALIDIELYNAGVDRLLRTSRNS